MCVVILYAFYVYMCVLFIDILQFTQKVQQMTNNFESAFTTSKFLLNECDLTVFARIRFDMMIKWYDYDNDDSAWIYSKFYDTVMYKIFWRWVLKKFLENLK